MRFLPRLPLYGAVVAAATACVLTAAATPAAAQFSTEPMQPEDREECVTPTDERDTLTSAAWATDFIGIEKAHQYNRGTFDGTDEPVTIAVIDSGVQADLPIFGGRVLEGFDFWDPEKLGQCDSNYHGTGVAAIAAGGAEGEQFIGVAPEAEILPLRAFQSDEGADEARSRMVASLIDDAVSLGADVINISIELLDDSELKEAVRKAIDNNVVVVAATGNAGAFVDRLDKYAPKDRTFYPAAYPGVIAVGAHNLDGQWYEKTNFGSHIDLLAPGQDVTFPYAGGGWITDSGTSFAAPYVAGAAALLKGYYGKDTTPEWIEARLEQTAIDPPEEFSIYQGHGVINLPRALTEPADPLEDADEPTEEGPAFPGGETPSIAAIDVDYDPLATEKLIAWASVGGSIVAIILVLVLRRIIPSGRRRGWKPGTRHGDNLPVKVEPEESH